MRAYISDASVLRRRIETVLPGSTSLRTMTNTILLNYTRKLCRSDINVPISPVRVKPPQYIFVVFFSLMCIAYGAYARTHYSLTSASHVFGIIKMICIMNAFGSSIACVSCARFLPSNARHGAGTILDTHARAHTHTDYSKCHAKFGVCNRKPTHKHTTPPQHEPNYTHTHTQKNASIRTETPTAKTRRYSSKLPNKSCYTACTRCCGDATRTRARASLGLCSK